MLVEPLQQIQIAALLRGRLSFRTLEEKDG